MGQTISSLIENLQQDSEKEKKANDALNALVEMAKLQQERFSLTVQNNIGNQKLIPVDVIIAQDGVLQATTSSEVTGVGEVISNLFSAFASGDVAKGVTSLVQTGLNILIGSYSGNTSSRDSYIITTGELGGVMRMDMHFFAYRYTSSQLTDICKQVISVNIVISSVDITKLSDSTLRAIVQNVYGSLPVDDQKRILAQLQDAAKNSLLSAPAPKVVAARLSRALRNVGNLQYKPVTEKTTFSIRTTIGSARSSASRFDVYLRGGIVQAYGQDSMEKGIELYDISVVCRVPEDNVSDDTLVGEIEIGLNQEEPESDLSTAAAMSRLSTVVRNLLTQAIINAATSDLPITTFEMGEYPPVPDMHEPLSALEWDIMKARFPRVMGYDPKEFAKTDLSTQELKESGQERKPYNCIAWTLGYTHRVVWDESWGWGQVPESLDNFVAFYKLCGFETCSAEEAEVDGYQLPEYPQKMTHASRQDNGIWSSKLGNFIRLNHPRGALDAADGPVTDRNQGYGRRVVHFKAVYGGPQIPGPLYSLDAVTASSTKISPIALQLATAFPQASGSFETKWKSWADSWLSPDKITSQLESTFTSGPEWDALVDMGPGILPMVVDKLKDPYNLFGCYLYNRLQSDTSKKISPTDLGQYYILNNQAQDIIRMYGDLVDEYEKRTRSWQAETEGVKYTAQPEAYTSGVAYKALAGMGTSIIPLVMYNYSLEKSAGWRQLLNELVLGKKSSATTFKSAQIPAEWAIWFQGL
ncbi:hypothetical protein F5Y05DRAFT_315467 [Hypoxylon sp. FL0543]|nr:hypothetical protein F5Y05DRAFT_315467 [Hypoxylon sp. FL0543]